MPALNNPRHEALAKALSRGVSVREATIEVGLSPRHVGRILALSSREDFDARVAELREAAEWGEDLALKPIHDQALKLANAAAKLESAAAMMAAKALLAEAARIRQSLPRRTPPPAVLLAPPAQSPARPVLSKEEWLAAFAPKS